MTGRVAGHPHCNHSRVGWELNRQFPGDVGVFSAFFLQVINFVPGEAIFLGAGEPHTYVSGDIIEVMAASDNILRAGLTPKHRDVDNLLASLTCTFGGTHSVMRTVLASATEYSKVYDSPVPEFSVMQVALPPGGREAHHEFDGPSVLIVTQGAGTLDAPEEKEADVGLQEGGVVFIGTGVGVTFTSGSAGRLVLYRVYCP